MTEIKIKDIECTPIEVSKILICSILEDLENKKDKYLEKICPTWDNNSKEDKEKIYNAISKTTSKIYKNLERFILIEKINN
jgi:hypothetical protein